MSEPDAAVSAEDIAAKEAAALFKIHGVDQRSSELIFKHDALGPDVSIRMRQDGSTSAAFVPGTSTVIWPCAYTLGDFLCDATAVGLLHHSRRVRLVTWSERAGVDRW
jgi:hypothetical protein